MVTKSTITRSKKVNFFRLVGGRQGGTEDFRQKIEETYEYLKTKKFSLIKTLTINDDKYYIEAMNKLALPKENDVELYCWLIDISRVDVNQEIAIADITKEIDKRRTTIEADEFTGPIVDSQIIFDPFRNVIGVLNNRGGVSLSTLKRFISMLIEKKGIKLEIILDEEGIKKIGKLDIATSVSYTVAAPDKFTSFRDDSRSEFGDMAYANFLSGNELKIEVRSEGLKKDNLANKVRALFSSEDVSIKTMKVDGMMDGREETIDLIKNKLVYTGWLTFEEKIKIKDAFDFLTVAYLDKYKYIKKYYSIV